jgi:hypothetical protein
VEYASSKNKYQGPEAGRDWVHSMNREDIGVMVIGTVI